MQGVAAQGPLGVNTPSANTGDGSVATATGLPKAKDLEAIAHNLRLQKSDIKPLTGEKGRAVTLDLSKGHEALIKNATQLLLGKMLESDKLQKFIAEQLKADNEDTATTQEMANQEMAALVNQLSDEAQGELAKALDHNPDLKAKIPAILHKAIAGNEELIERKIAKYLGKAEGTLDETQKKTIAAHATKTLAQIGAPPFYAQLIAYVLDPAPTKKGQVTKAAAAAGLGYSLSGFIQPPVMAIMPEVILNAFQTMDEYTGNRTFALMFALTLGVFILVYQCAHNCCGKQKAD